MSDHPDLSDVGDLSWDEGDLPHQEIKVAAAAAFMGVGLIFYGSQPADMQLVKRDIFVQSFQSLNLGMLDSIRKVYIGDDTTDKSNLSRCGLSMTSWVNTTNSMPTSTIFRLF